MFSYVYKFLNNYYLRYKITPKQSLAYQIMLILMNEHYLSRLGLNNLGKSIGDNSLYIEKNEENLKKLVDILYSFISNNYRNIIKQNIESYEEFLIFVIALINSIDSDYCMLKEETFMSNENDNKSSKKIIFEMKQEGYRYQYNGYIQKDYKLQEFANRLTIFGVYLTLLFWLYDKQYINFKNNFWEIIIVTLSYFLIYIFRHKKLSYNVCIALYGILIYLLTSLI